MICDNVAEVFGGPNHLKRKEGIFLEENNGFIKLHRKFLNWQWYTEPNVMRVFLHLLLKATFKEFKWKEENISKGQVVVGRKKLAEELKISESQVRTALKKLERSGEITVKSTNKYSVITIRKWDFFQNEKSFLCRKKDRRFGRSLFPLRKCGFLFAGHLFFLLHDHFFDHLATDRTCLCRS